MDGWVGRWMEEDCLQTLPGWMDGWMGEWKDVKAGLRIAYSNQKLVDFCNF